MHTFPEDGTGESDSFIGNVETSEGVELKLGTGNKTGNTTENTPKNRGTTSLKQPEIIHEPTIAPMELSYVSENSSRRSKRVSKVNTNALEINVYNMIYIHPYINMFVVI